MDSTDFITNPEILVGQKVSVFYHKHNRWYDGTVKSYDSKTKKHHIKYDDRCDRIQQMTHENFKFGYSKKTKTFEYHWRKEFFDFFSQKRYKKGERENLFSDSVNFVQENKIFDIPCLEEFKGIWKISGLPDYVNIGLLNGKIYGEFKEIGEFECSVYLCKINSENELSFFKQDLTIRVESEEHAHERKKNEIFENLLQDYLENHELRKQEEKEKLDNCLIVWENILSKEEEFSQILSQSNDDLPTFKDFYERSKALLIQIDQYFNLVNLGTLPIDDYNSTNESLVSFLEEFDSEKCV